MQLSLEVTTDSLGQVCRRLQRVGHPSVATVSLRRTFHDDFDEHPLSHGKWAPHYAGGAAWPEARYWGGEGSDFKRKTAWNGEQQIYVDPRYAGRSTTPLGLDPFTVRDGLLSIVASRTPPALKEVLFNNEYVSGILTTQGSFAQKFGYFEIRAKIPVGQGVWPAFWMLADNGGWPPEIDILEGRGQRPGDLVMTTHWRIPATGVVKSCGFDFHGAGRAHRFPRLRRAVAAGPADLFHRPQAGIRHRGPRHVRRSGVYDRQSGDGHEDASGVGFVDATSPVTVAFEIDRISAWQIDP